MTKNKIIIAVMTVTASAFTAIQAACVWGKYQLFLTDYNSQLWENHIADSAFWMSYLFTAGLLAFGCQIFTSRHLDRPVFMRVIRAVLACSILISIIASAGLFTMHKKHMLVGYDEWIRHCRQTGEQTT